MSVVPFGCKTLKSLMSILPTFFLLAFAFLAMFFGSRSHLPGVAKQFSQDSGLSRWRFPVFFWVFACRSLSRWEYPVMPSWGWLLHKLGPWRKHNILWEAVSRPNTHLPKKCGQNKTLYSETMVIIHPLRLAISWQKTWHLGGIDSPRRIRKWPNSAWDFIPALDFIISDQRISKYLVSFGSRHGFCQAWVNLSTGLTVDGRSWRMAPNTWTTPSRPVLKKEGVVKSGIWASLFCPKRRWEFLQLKWFVFWIVDWPEHQACYSHSFPFSKPCLV